jgi:hypothetical protein
MGLHHLHETQLRLFPTCRIYFWGISLLSSQNKCVFGTWHTSNRLFSASCECEACQFKGLIWWIIMYKLFLVNDKETFNFLFFSSLSESCIFFFWMNVWLVNKTFLLVLLQMHTSYMIHSTWQNISYKLFKDPKIAKYYLLLESWGKQKVVLQREKIEVNPLPFFKFFIN